MAVNSDKKENIVLPNNKTSSLAAVFLSLLSVLFVTACQQTPVQLEKPLLMNNAAEPCWLRTPNCKAEPGFQYFVGQSAQPIASLGRPSRDSFHSAQRDAEREYARFLGVDISASSFLQNLFKDENYEVQFTETVQENFDTRVSDVLKSDQYYMSTHQTTDGQPLWLVYVLIKVSNDNIAKHKQRIEQELADKKVQQALELKNKKDEWTISLFNIDEVMSVFVNDKKINQCDFAENCEVKLTPHLLAGQNTVRIEVSNALVWWTYGYDVQKNGETLYKGKCGVVWLFPCAGYETGVVHSFEFDVQLSR